MHKKFFISSEIAKIEGVSRAAISQRMKRGLTKIYKEALRNKYTTRPYETFEYLLYMFKLNDEQSASEFFGAFPESIQKSIITDAAKLNNLRK